MPYPPKTNPEAILSAALQLLEADGMEGLTMRSLADALGLRASSLYRHYPDRDALEAALGDEAGRLIGEGIARAVDGQPPKEALRWAAHAYLDFAREHSALYALIHAPRPPAPARPGPGKDTWNLLLEVVGAVSGRPDDTSGTVALWSFLHGFVGLERSGVFGLSGPLDGFERGLNALVEGL